MGLSRAFLEAHILHWESELDGSYYTHRSKWPSRLFHHAPLQNTVPILESGRLLSRIDSENHRGLDVAGPNIISSRDIAHKFVRLYFRPRTPTQYAIEGIQKPSDDTHGAHAPILYMLVLDARKILLSQGVKFSDSNMQSGLAQYSDTEDFFSQIEFDKVFHEGGIGGDRSILRCRCAEVLAPSPLALRGTLQWVYCRSEGEKLTLLHKLSPEARRKWADKIIVSDDLVVFQKRFPFVKSVSLSKKGVVYQIAPRPDLAKISVDVEVFDRNGDRILYNRLPALATAPNLDSSAIERSTATKWLSAIPLRDGKYLVRLTLEGHLAFESLLTLQTTPF